MKAAKVKIYADIKEAAPGTYTNSFGFSVVRVVFHKYFEVGGDRDYDEVVANFKARDFCEKVSKRGFRYTMGSGADRFIHSRDVIAVICIPAGDLEDVSAVGAAQQDNVVPL